MLSFIACAERRPSLNAVQIQTLGAIYRRAESHVRSSLRQVGRLKSSYKISPLSGLVGDRAARFVELCIDLCFRFNGHFSDEPRLAGTRMSPFWILLSLRMMEVVVTTGAIDAESSSQVVTINKHPAFLQAGCHSCRPTNSVKALKGMIYDLI